MQIHEITLTEAGILQGIKSAAKSVAGGIRGAQQGLQQAQQNRKLSQTTGTALKVWNQYTDSLKRTVTDPTRYQQVYQQALTAFVQKNFLKGATIASTVNAQEINQVIAQVTASRDDPAKLAQAFTELIQQAAVSLPAPQGQGAVQVISQNPMVVQFRNKTYILSSVPGQQGEWVDQATGKTLDPTWQAYLDSQTGLGQP